MSQSQRTWERGKAHRSRGAWGGRAGSGVLLMGFSGSPEAWCSDPVACGTLPIHGSPSSIARSVYMRARRKKLWAPAKTSFIRLNIECVQGSGPRNPILDQNPVSRLEQTHFPKSLFRRCRKKPLPLPVSVASEMTVTWTCHSPRGSGKPNTQDPCTLQ